MAALPPLVKAFDFNHMNNVLISRDCRKARLIDIDGNSKGSIQCFGEKETKERYWYL